MTDEERCHLIIEALNAEVIPSFSVQGLDACALEQASLAISGGIPPMSREAFLRFLRGRGSGTARSFFGWPVESTLALIESNGREDDCKALVVGLS